MPQVFCDWVFVNGKRKGTICNRRVNIEGRTQCWMHCPETIEKKIVRRKEFYEQNKEYELKCNEQYRQRNKERIAQQSKDRQKKNPEKYSKQHKEWRNRNVEKCLILHCKGQDKKHNRYFNLTEEWVKKLLRHQEWLCFHCSKYLLLEKGNKDPDQISIDRVNNSKGHSKGNVVLSCWDCNYTRRKKDINIFTPNPKYTILKDDE